MSVKIVYQDLAPGAAEDASVSATNKDAVSDVSLLPFGSDNTAEYATLEDNFWTLDGTIDILDDEDISFWSSTLSGAAGSFATSSRPVITITFTNRITTLGIYLSFRGDSYASSLTVVWYDGTTQLDSKTFTPNAMEYFCSNTVQNYDKIVITFTKTSLPRRRVRLDKILFGIVRTFEQSELRSGSAKVVQQIDNTSRELPTNTLDFKLSSRESVEFIFQTKQQIAAYDGNTLIGFFYIDDSSRQAENIYDIQCVDAIGVLENDPFPDAYYSSVNALTLAQAICGDFAVEMEASLQSKTLSGILYGQNRRTALQQLCFALGAVADTSGTDKIKIFTLASGTPVELDENRLRPGGAVSKAPVVTAVTVTAHSYSTSGSGQGIKIGNTTYYDTTSTYTITNTDVPASEKPNIVEIRECTLVSPANLQAVTQKLFDEVTRRNTHRVKFHVNGERPGEYVQTITPWNADFIGHYITGSITLSGFALADAEVIEE